jgi:hypothetical protein
MMLMVEVRKANLKDKITGKSYTTNETAAYLLLRLLQPCSVPVIENGLAHAEQ